MTYPQNITEIVSAMLKSQTCTDLRKESECHVLTRICVKSCGHLGKYTDFSNHFMKNVLIFLGYISSLLNETSIVLSILVSDLHSFLFGGISAAVLDKEQIGIKIARRRINNLR